MIKKIGKIGTVIGLLLSGFCLLVFSSSAQTVDELEEKLKTLSGKEKIALLNEFAGKNVRKLPEKSLNQYQLWL